MTAWRFDWRRSWDAVWSPDFLSTWEQVLEASPRANIYHRPAIVRAWAETHGRAIGAQPMFGLAEHSSGARVLLTFIVTAQRGRFASRRSLSAAGEGYFGYHDPCVAAGADAVDWSPFWDLVRLQTADACDQGLLRFVHADFANGPLTAPGDASPLIDLANDTSLDEVFARCSSKHRHETRRLLRRLGERGAVALEAGEAGNVALASEIWSSGFLPVYSAYWRAKSSGSMLDRPGVLGFANRVVDEGTRDGWAECGRMMAGPSAAAWYVGLIFRDSFFLWISAYEPSFLEFSPGRLMLALLIERCITRGWKSLHLMTGDQQYKREWHPVEQSMRSIRWHAPTFKGRLLDWYDTRHRPIDHTA